MYAPKYMPPNRRASESISINKTPAGRQLRDVNLEAVSTVKAVRQLRDVNLEAVPTVKAVQSRNNNSVDSQKSTRRFQQQC